MDYVVIFLLILLFFGIISAFCGSIHNYFTNIKSNNFITFDIDCGGLNNIRLQLELLVGLAWLSGRTLVLPKKRTWAHLGPDILGIEDVFDLNKLRKHIRIIDQLPYKPLQTHAPTWGAAVSAFLDPKELEKHRNEHVWHFYCNHDNRLMAAAECYFSKFDPEVLKIIRKSVDFRPKFYTQAKTDLDKLGLKPGQFDAIHIRNWENGADGKPQQPLVNQESVASKIAKLRKPLLMLNRDVTTGKDLNESLRDSFKPPKRESELENAVVDMIMASKAGHFVGTPASTYSTGIMSLREEPDFDFLGNVDTSTCKEDSWNFHVIKPERFN